MLVLFRFVPLEGNFQLITVDPVVPDGSSAGNLSLEKIGRALSGIILPIARFIWTSVSLVLILLFIPSVVLSENRARALYDYLSQALEDSDHTVTDKNTMSFLVSIFSMFVLYGILEAAIEFAQSSTLSDRGLLLVNVALWIYIALPIPLYLSFLIIRNFLLRMVFVIPGPRWYRGAALRSSLLASWALTKLDGQALGGFNDLREIMSNLNAQLLTILGGLSVVRASVTRISDKIAAISDEIFQKYLHDRQSLIDDLQGLRDTLVRSLDGGLNIEDLLGNNYVRELVTRFERKSGKRSVESEGVMGVVVSVLAYSSVGDLPSMGILLMIVFGIFQIAVEIILFLLRLLQEISGFIKVPQEGDLAIAILLIILGLSIRYFIRTTIPEGTRVDRTDLIAMILLSLSVLTSLGFWIYIIHIIFVIFAITAPRIPPIPPLRERRYLSNLLILVPAALSLVAMISSAIPRDGALAFKYEAIPLVILLFFLCVAASFRHPPPRPEGDPDQ